METRKPAPIVRCEHCKWQGSSRGLFTHVRLAHPGISEVPPNQTREHPLSINSGRWKESKYRVSTDIQPRKQKMGEVDYLNSGIGNILIEAFINLAQDKRFHEILTREGVNPNRLVTALGKI